MRDEKGYCESWIRWEAWTRWEYGEWGMMGAVVRENEMSKMGWVKGNEGWEGGLWELSKMGGMKGMTMVNEEWVRLLSEKRDE